jgi:hypothetical protein
MKVKIFRCPLGCPLPGPLPENELCELKVTETRDPVYPPVRCPYTLRNSEAEEWVLVDEYEVEE